MNAPDLAINDMGQAGPAPIATGNDNRALAVTAAVVVAVLVATLLAVVTVWLSSKNADKRHTEAAAAASYLAGPNALAAETAAANETRAALTYNYNSLTKDFATAEAGLTPSFRANYISKTKTDVVPLATQYHAVSTATVAAQGVSAATTDSATVLLFVDQTVENSQLAHPRLDMTRVKVSMLKIDGRWLVNNLQPL